MKTTYLFSMLFLFSCKSTDKSKLINFHVKNNSGINIEKFIINNFYYSEPISLHIKEEANIYLKLPEFNGGIGSTFGYSIYKNQKIVSSGNFGYFENKNDIEQIKNIYIDSNLEVKINYKNFNK